MVLGRDESRPYGRVRGHPSCCKRRAEYDNPGFGFVGKNQILDESIADRALAAHNYCALEDIHHTGE
jgi:hypothetical protein